MPRGVRRLAAAASAALLLAVLTSGCGVGLDQKTISAINGTIAQINYDSASWSIQLTELEKNLTDTGSQWVAEVKQIAYDAGNNVGDQARCTTQYVGQYVIEKLTAVVDTILHKPVPAEHPVICTTDPIGQLNMGDVQNGKVTALKLDGYGISSGLGLAWVDRSGTRHPIPGSYLQSPTQFLADMPLGGANGFTVPQDAQSFVYLDNGAEIPGHSLPIYWPSGSPQPPNAGVTVLFNTTDNGKGPDSILTVTVVSNRGPTDASWTQSGSEAFEPNSSHGITTEPYESYPITDLVGPSASVTVCIAASSDTWTFDARIYVSTTYGQLYRFDETGQTLDQTPLNRCRSYHLFQTAPAVIRPTKSGRRIPYRPHSALK